MCEILNEINNPELLILSINSCLEKLKDLEK
jgi:hypothetical protein